MRLERMRWSRVVAAAAAFAAAACSGAACGASTPSVSAPVLLQKAKQVVDDATAAHFVLTSTNVSLSNTNIVSGRGDLARPDSLRGSFSVAHDGFTLNVNVVSVNGVFEAEVPFSAHYQKTDPASFGLTDPAELFDPRAGLSSLLTLARDPKLGPQQRLGGELLETVTYQIPGSSIPVLPNENPSAPVTLTAAVDPTSYQLRNVTLVGPLTSATSNSTYVLTLSDYDEHVSIALPPAS